jgi:hypothetical protein
MDQMEAFGLRPGKAQALDDTSLVLLCALTSTFASQAVVERMGRATSTQAAHSGAHDRGRPLYVPGSSRSSTQGRPSKSSTPGPSTLRGAQAEEVRRTSL